MGNKLNNWQMFNILKKHILNYIFEIKNKNSVYYKKTYSQNGEDLIIKLLSDKLKIFNLTYIDIGAFHPYLLSNTALLYLNGCRGINIEPNPVYFKSFVKNRPEDINLNIGISLQNKNSDYYMFNEPALNTFSSSEKENNLNQGKKLIDIIKIQTTSIHDILNSYCKNKFPDLLSIDIEGLDEEVIRSIDYSKSYPKIICIETISFKTVGFGEKKTSIISFLIEKGYTVFADTHINTILYKEK